MNARRLLPLLSILFVGVTSLHGATLPKDVRETTNGASVRAKVEALVKENAEKLASNDPAVQHDAREALIAEVVPSGALAATPSAQFLDVYNDVLNATLLPMAKGADARASLNAAIVATRVAERSNSARLVPTAASLLGDQRQALVLWGLKLSKFLMVPTLNASNAKDSPLMPAFVDAASKNIKMGQMVQAAYDAFKGMEKANPPPNAAAINSAAKALHTLMMLRRDELIAGLPEVPTAENAAMLFLMDEKIWKAQTPDLQLKTIQLASDFISLGGQRIGAAAGNDRNELLSLIKQSGSALTVLGKHAKLPKIEALGLSLYQISAVAAGNNVEKLASGTYAGLKENPAWQNLKPPPEIQK